MAEEMIQQDNQPAAEAVSAEAPEQTVQSTELDGLSKFTFQGQELTPDQLHKIFSEHKSLSEQQKTFSEEKKYLENLDADLTKVLNDPRLAAQFRQVYPKQFHPVLDKVLRDQRQAQAQPETAQPALPKEFLTEFERMKETIRLQEQRAFEAEVQSANAKLDSMLPPLWKKYPLAVEDQVYARAEALLNQGQKLSEKTWERMVRESHESFQKKSDQFYSAKLKSQLEKGQRGQGEGPGGATPGQAPVKARNFDEAREAMLRHVGAKT